LGTKVTGNGTLTVVKTAKAGADLWFLRQRQHAVMQVMLVINPAVDCHYFLPLPRLPS